jgi:S1-C subfamily serine protease
VWIAAGGGALFLVVLGVVVVYFMTRETKDTPVAVSTPTVATTGRPSETTTSVGRPGRPQAPVQETATPETPSGGGSGAGAAPASVEGPGTTAGPGAAAGPPATDTGGQVYQRLLKSTVLIFAPVRLPDGRVGIGSGSGTLIDKTNRLILTNFHVVGDADDVAVFFPTYQNGRLVAEIDYFFKQVQEKKQSILRGKPVVKDSKVDLALVQLDKLPPGVDALPLATAAPVVTQHV